MMDFLSLFRRRPAKRGRSAFAREGDAISSFEDSLEDLLPHAVRDAPPIARETPMSGYSAPRQPQPGAAVRQQERPRQRPKAAPPQPRTNGAAAAPQLLRRP